MTLDTDWTHGNVYRVWELPGVVPIQFCWLTSAFYLALEYIWSQSIWKSGNPKSLGIRQENSASDIWQNKIYEITVGKSVTLSYKTVFLYDVLQ